MTHSLQGRLLLGIAVGSTLVLVAAGLALHESIQAELLAEYDASLVAEARTLAALVDSKWGSIASEMVERELPRFVRPDRPDYYQLWRPDGTVIERSSRLPPHDLTRISGARDEPQFASATLPDGRPGRVVGITFIPRRDDEIGADDDERTAESLAGSSAEQFSPPPVTLVVAGDVLDLNRSMARLRLLLVGVLGAAVPLSLLVAAPLVRLGLRPLRATAERIAAIDDHHLGARLDAAAAPREVQSVIDRLNDLLARLAEAMERERAFSANVAHELRTPLAGLRSLLEVALSRPREAGDYRGTLARCLQISEQTGALVENLLMLARIDAGQCSTRLDVVSLNDALQEAWQPFADRAAERGLKVGWEAADCLGVQTDVETLRVIVRNLLDNAVGHADDAGTIRIAAERVGDRVRLRVSNSGSRLSPEQSRHVFERFWRGDAARGDTGRHAGLGLPLSRELARLIGATLSVTSELDGEFVALLDLPLATNAAASEGRDCQRPLSPLLAGIEVTSQSGPQDTN